MAPSDAASPDTAAFEHSGTGPQNINSGDGEQCNPTISGGSGNTQFNATHQHFQSNASSDQDQLDIRFREKLYVTCPWIDRNDLLDRKHGIVDGTCEWILDTAQYKAWLREDAERLLWVWGEPGKGKTMLSIFLTQELDKAATPMYFFCSAKREGCDNAIAVLRGLLWHLTEVYPTSTRVLRGSFQSAIADAISSRETLWKAFIMLVKSSQPTQLYCVVNGLDDCDPSSRRWLARKFLSLNSDHDARNIKVILISCYLADLEGSSQIRLDSEFSKQIGSSVKLFIETRIKELSHWLAKDDESLEEIQTKLIKGAHDRFLWVGHVMGDLLEQERQLNVKDLLGKLPTSLYPVYARIFESIELDPEGLILCILRLVVVACRPLSFGELAFAIRCGKGLQKETQLHVDGEIVQNLVENCGLLFHVSKQKVDLEHDMIRDYVRENILPDGRGLMSEDTHLQLAWACIDVLAGKPSGHLLASYATDHWPGHARGCGMLAKKLISHPSLFFDVKSGARTNWWHAHVDSESWHPYPWRPWNRDLKPKDLPDIHMASYLGINPWIEEIEDKRTWLRSGSWSYWGTVIKEAFEGMEQIHWAVLGKQESTVVMLQPDSRLTDSCDFTPLHHAAAAGSEAIVKRLLDFAVDINARDLLGRSGLHLAVMNDHKTTVKLLLGRGANVDTQFCRCATPPLHWAARRNDRMLVKLLLEHGADVNARMDGLQTCSRHRDGKDGREVSSLRSGYLARVARLRSEDARGFNYAVTWNRESMIEQPLDFTPGDQTGNRREGTALLEVLQDIDMWMRTGNNACAKEARATVRILFKYGAKWDSKTKKQYQSMVSGILRRSDRGV